MISGQHDKLMSDINVTPFVDVMLVLLIIFMVAAPMMMGTRRPSWWKYSFSKGSITPVSGLRCHYGSCFRKPGSACVSGQALPTGR